MNAREARTPDTSAAAFAAAAEREEWQGSRAWTADDDAAGGSTRSMIWLVTASTALLAAVLLAIGAWHMSGTAGASEVEHLADVLHAAWSTGDHETLRAQYARTAVLHHPTGDIRGVERIVEYADELAAVSGGTQLRRTSQGQEGGTFASWAFELRIGEEQGTGVSVVRIVEGKVAEHWVFASAQ